MAYSYWHRYRAVIADHNPAERCSVFLLKIGDIQGTMKKRDPTLWSRVLAGDPEHLERSLGLEAGHLKPLQYYEGVIDVMKRLTQTIEKRSTYYYE